MNKKTPIYRPDSQSVNQEKVASNNNQALPQGTEIADSHTEVQKRRQQIDEKVEAMPTEYGGRTKEKGLEPTRYNDWELKGRCVDF